MGAEDGDIPFWGIPIATIERIEVVRGPGSVIYGTNASAGIINVVTKRKGKAYVETHVGTALTNFGGYFDHQTEQGDLSLGFEVQRADTKELKVTGAAAIDPCFVFQQLLLE